MKKILLFMIYIFICVFPLFSFGSSKHTSQTKEEFVEFSTLDHAKSNGLNIHLKYPSSWTKKEGIRPHVVQDFVSKDGSECILNVSQVDSKFSQIEWEEIFKTATLEDINGFLGTQQMYFNTNFKYTKIDSLDGIIIYTDSKAEQVGVKLFGKNMMVVLGYSDNLITLLCSSMDGFPLMAEKMYNNNYSTFMQIANSIVIMDQWQNKTTTETLSNNIIKNQSQSTSTTNPTQNKGSAVGLILYVLIIGGLIFFLCKKNTKKTQNNKLEKCKNQYDEQAHKIVKTNLIIFAVLYGCCTFLIELSDMTNFPGNIGARVAGRVFFQYIISKWIICKTINIKDPVKIASYTWIISLCILIVRILLGTWLWSFIQ